MSCITTAEISYDWTTAERSNSEIKLQQVDRVLFDNLPAVGMIVQAATRRIVACNRVATGYGVSPGTSCYESWVQRTTPCPWCLASKLCTTGTVQRLSRVQQIRHRIWKLSWIPLDGSHYVHLAWDVTVHKRIERRLKRTLLAAKYRLRELECLHAVTQLLGTTTVDPHGVLQSFVNLVASYWPTAHCCGVRLHLANKVWASGRLRDGTVHDVATVRRNDHPVGVIEICRLRNDSSKKNRRSQTFLWLLADQLGKYLDKVEIERALQAKQETLTEANSTLRRILQQVHQSESADEKSVAANTSESLMSLVVQLKNDLPLRYRPAVDQLEQKLIQVTSPLVKTLIHAAPNLTATELEVCALIRQGLTTKEIAKKRHVSPATVEKQREQIRRKLNISGTGVNLAAYLMQLADGENT